LSELTKHAIKYIESKGNNSSSLDSILDEAKNELELQMLLIEVASCNDQADFRLIAKAYEFASLKHAGQHRKSGRPFLQHCVEVARLLAQLRLDDTTIAAGLLHDVIEDTETTHEEISLHFNPKIADLIDGVTKIDQFTYESREERQAETYRKMLLSMVKDIRVILIKLVDRLHNMRTLEHVAPEAQKRIARETLDIYAPLAHRFGLARIRWELEDRSLKFTHPQTYAELREKVSMKRREREDYIEEFKKPIEEELCLSEITAEISGRPKNFFSIYSKMCSRNKPFEEIYDLFAIRITVSSVRECYHTLGLVHGIYSPIPERIKDYISTPKSNMYQSLHASVIGPKGLPVEVQIRTKEMHHTAELGIAAHWRYKSGQDSAELDQHLNWLQHVIDIQQHSTNPTEFLEDFKIELFRDEIFVFTPRGDLLQLPKGATPVDFAFHIHTDIGLQCLTAKVNNQIVSLNEELKSGDTIEIITNPQQSPDHSWLESVKTGKAQQAIRRWLKDERSAHSRRLGQEILEREIKRHSHGSIAKENIVSITKELGIATTENLYTQIGSGYLSIRRVINLLAPHIPELNVPCDQDTEAIHIHNVNDFAMNLGKCCRPIPEDAIVGLVSSGDGISIHRTDCHKTGHLGKIPEKILQASWNTDSEQLFTVRLRIEGDDRKFLLSDISQSLGDCGCNIQSATTETIDKIAKQDFWIDVKSVTHMNSTIVQLLKIDGIIKVERYDEQNEHLV
tara:strand:+ start:481 stop:2691 length:2211 start_codon:yes stop_codon:yes gene_type:complete